MFKYFVANDGIGGVKIRLSGTDVQKVPEVIAVMVKADHHEATAEEYREACKKARLADELKNQDKRDTTT